MSIYTRWLLSVFIVACVVLSGGCKTQPATVDKLVNEVQYEFDLLQPGVEEAAHRAVKLANKEAKQIGRPVISGEILNTRPINPLEPNAPKEGLASKTYDVTLTLEQTQYQFLGIETICRTGWRDIPFKAKVNVIVTKSKRTAEAQRTEKLRDLPGQHKLVEAELDELPLKYRVKPISALMTYTEGYIPEDAPAALLEAYREAKNKLDKTKPDITCNYETIVLTFNAEKNCWSSRYDITADEFDAQFEKVFGSLKEQEKKHKEQTGD